MRRAFPIATLTVLAAAPGARAAITVAANAAAPALRVDARGNAEISWRSGLGAGRSSLLVARTGRMVRGGTLPGLDLARPLAGSQIPFQLAIVSGPGGWMYALQTWRPLAGRAVALRFSCWRGVPAGVTLASSSSPGSVELTGRSSLGKAARAAQASLDASTGVVWQRLDVPLGSDGSFRTVVALTSLRRTYRVTVPGPNLGSTFWPDAAATADALSDLDPRR